MSASNEARHYTVPDFIDPDLSRRMQLPPQAMMVAGQIRQILLDAATSLNQGHHMCALAEQEPFRTSLDLCQSLCSSIDEARLRDCAILLRRGSQADAIDNDALAARLMRITIKHDNGHAGDDEDDTIKRFFVRLRHQHGIRDVSRAWKATWKTYRFTFDPLNNGRYPIRDLWGRAIRIVHVDPQDALSEGYAPANLAPFIDETMSEAARAALYDQLECVVFTRAMMKHEREDTMLGQNTVLARRSIAAGDCVGVYGGTFIPTGDLQQSVAMVDFSYMLATTPRDFRQQTSIDGDNVIAKINTVLDYDILSGVPGEEPRGSFNIRFVPFRIDLADGNRTHLGAAFATAPIASGEELRINYNYNVQSVRKTFG